MTLEVEREFMAELHDAFLEEKHAVVGEYVAPGGIPGAPALDARGFIQRGCQPVADDMVLAQRDEVWLLREDVEPQAGGRFTADGSTWELQQCYREDAMLSYWIARPLPVGVTP